MHPIELARVRRRRQAGLNESVNEVYKLLLPIWEKARQYDHMSYGHLDLHECLKELHQITQTRKPRYMASYFRVAFFGKRFEILNGREFIYREKRITRLAEVNSRLEHLYGKKFGADNVEIIGSSNTVDPATLDPSKVSSSICSSSTS